MKWCPQSKNAYVPNGSKLKIMLGFTVIKRTSNVIDTISRV